MASIKSLEQEITDLEERSSEALTESERLLVLSANYDANGLPSDADLNKNLAAQRAIEAKKLSDNANAKRKEKELLESQVAQLNKEITDLEQKRTNLIG